MEPWYKVATPRKEVREGRSFNPDEFAIALEQVVAGTAPDDYRKPDQFFARNCFTRALRDHTGIVLRRLVGKSENTPPVLTLITQFGGGKTHTLTVLYHLVKHAKKAGSFKGVESVLREAGVAAVPESRVAVFVGNAWDPSEESPNPWVDIARQLAGEQGVKILGEEGKAKAPGTDNLRKLYDAAGGRVVVLFDEVLNFLSRHRDRAEAFRSFLANLVRSMTGVSNCTAVVSLPQSKPELDDWELRWQELIAKEVGRVAKQLIANDEAEISEVVRNRLFDDLGSERIRKNVSKAFADWCFERRAQLPAHWTAVDTANTEAKSREFLQSRFEACYPFHPATLSVFQRKWATLSLYQQTRGTLAMLAQWISIASQESFKKARTEPLITLGSAPLSDPGFRAVVLSQLGESRLMHGIDADIAGDHSHARALDADTSGPLRDIHRRVGGAVLFESSGGQTEKIAHLPDLRFALGEPDLDTTSIDNAAFALEDKSYYIRRVGADGFKISHQATLKKVVSDRRASLDEDSEVRPAMRKLVEDEFRRGATIPVIPFREDGSEIQDTPKLALIVMDADSEWTGEGSIRERIAEWTKQRGKSPRLYPGSLVWCIKKPGRDFRDKVELWLAWRRVAKEIAEGGLGADYEKADRADIQSKVAGAETAAKDEVWGGYRFAVLADSHEPDGLKVIDLGAGHSSSGETLSGRVIAALKSEALLNESVGAGYIDRNWPPALKDSGEWPMASLRQSFLNGSLTRLLDPDVTLRTKIAQFVENGDFGLGTGKKSDGAYERFWFKEVMPYDEVSFDNGVFLVARSRAEAVKAGAGAAATTSTTEAQPEPPRPVTPEPPTVPGAGEQAETVTVVSISGTIPPETWNRLGTKILPKLRSGSDLRVGVDFKVTVPSSRSRDLIGDLQQALDDLGISGQVRISESDSLI